ncbi:hypothetical protein NOCARDAX2BIS_190011 [Nocardioides sp. AX2bis]|nr:hypothetical protein NOCARDAX2BIS_190011 [Nocardioides sp. AX2bis]
MAREIEDGIGASAGPDVRNVSDSLALQLFDGGANRIGVDVLDRDHPRSLVGDRDRPLLPAGSVEGGAVRENGAVVSLAPSHRRGAGIGGRLP